MAMCMTPGQTLTRGDVTGEVYGFATEAQPKNLRKKLLLFVSAEDTTTQIQLLPIRLSTSEKNRGVGYQMLPASGLFRAKEKGGASRAFRAKILDSAVENRPASRPIRNLHA